MSMSETTGAACATIRKRRVGIVGFGHLGQYLAQAVVKDAALSSQFELAFVWNRSVERLAGVDYIHASQICHDLTQVASFAPDVIVEVSHPAISKQFGPAFLQVADFVLGSPTAFADAEVEATLRAAATKHTLYVPAGALWGSQDIARLAARGQLAECEITMKKHPASLKLEGVLGERVADILAAGTTGESVVFAGSVRELCPLAPNNVNTMAAAAIAAVGLGFDGVRARLVADPALDAHVITIDVRGPKAADGSQFIVQTTRVNPSPPGAVTGAATYASFLSSLIAARGQAGGVHLC